MKINTVRSLLEELGYTFVLKEGEWVRCAISGHGEQWLGKGLDEETAAQDACNNMFPSKAARDFLEKEVRRLEAGPPAEKTEAPETPPRPIPDPASTLDPPVVAMPEPDPIEPEPEPEPEPRTKETPIVRRSPAAQVEKAPVIPVHQPGLRIVQPAPPARTYVSAPEEEEEEEEEEKISQEEGLEILGHLLEEIEDEVSTLAVSSSLTQRLQLAAWIFQARSIQEQFKTDSKIEDATHKIAIRLTHLCKIFWPGSVRALQVYTTPNQGLEGLMRTRKIPTRWSEAAEIVNEFMEETEERSGYDDYGWKDAASLKPGPPNPDKMLEEAITKIESVVGSLGGHLDEKQKSVPGRTVVGELEELILAAHLIRWTRGTARDRQRWGQAMGALRWAARQTRQRVDGLSRLLEDDFVPPKPWAQLLGRDPEENRKNSLRKQVMKAMPTGEWLEEDVMSWLHKAFQVFSNPQIAKLATAVRGEILEFTNADFADADRNTRSRLRKLQAIFRNQTDLSRVDLPSEEELKTTDDEEDDDTSPSSTVIDPTELIRTEVEKITRDKHILFVTNRDDQRLRKDLEEALRCKVTLKDGGNPRTIKAIIKSVDSTKYDFVLMATGFNNASADAALCRATKAEGLPYVRVQKGRLAATIRALGRAFNVGPESHTDTEETAAHEA